MSGLIRAEIIKLIHRKLYWVLSTVLLALVGLLVFVMLVLPKLVPQDVQGLTLPVASDAIKLGVQQILGQSWFPLILAVVALGTDVSRTIWASSLTRDARRWAHLIARLLVFWPAVLLTSLVLVLVWTVAASILVGGSVGMGVAGWLALVWKAALIELAWVAIGLFAIAVFRSTGIAIGVALAFSFIEGLLRFWSAYRPISLSGASASLLGGFGAAESEPLTRLLGTGMSQAQAVAVLVGWSAVMLAGAWAGLRYRDP